MGLVGYSDSEESDNEQRVTTSAKSSSGATKPSFQRVVDKSNPHKIQVNLPEISGHASPKSEATEEPPAKKLKLGSSGFNSFLPAPKRAAAPTLSTTSNKDRGPPGRKITLKTAAEPSFSREALPTLSDDYQSATGSYSGEDGDKERETASREVAEEPKKIGNAMMFKPLSVARRPMKKKPSTLAEAAASGSVEGRNVKVAEVARKEPPKISLFSMTSGEDDGPHGQQTGGSYQPVLYGASEQQVQGNHQLDDDGNDGDDTKDGPVNRKDMGQNINPASIESQSQSLHAVAEDLGLSESARRQLMGRKKGKDISVLNFNTDAEYRANEEFRAQSELQQQQQHNPVRSIQAGKHSLRQLVNAVSNQKDALEESFATGKRNKREAGSKYGW